MTLQDFRQLTSHLGGELELLCAGAPIETVYHADQVVSVDDSHGIEADATATVLYGELES